MKSRRLGLITNWRLPQATETKNMNNGGKEAIEIIAEMKANWGVRISGIISR